MLVVAAASAFAAIPKTMHVSYSRDFIDNPITSNEMRMQKNVIALYDRADMDFIAMHTDEDCFSKIRSAGFSQLADAMLKEKYSPFISDVCRLFFLNATGGVYFDNDIIIADNVDVMGTIARSGASFVSAVECCNGGLHNAFIAVAPGHPIIHSAIRLVDLFYQGELLLDHKLVGPGTLWLAFQAYVKEQPHAAADILLLQEDGSPSTSLQTTHQSCNMGIWRCSTTSVPTGVRASKICDWREDTQAELLMHVHAPGSRQCPDLYWQPLRFFRDLMWQQRRNIFIVVLIAGAAAAAFQPYRHRYQQKICVKDTVLRKWSQ
jgi:hypothetical protein